MFVLFDTRFLLTPIHSRKCTNGKVFYIIATVHAQFFCNINLRTNGKFEMLFTHSSDIVSQLIIYMKKLLDSDWLRAVQFKCNTRAKSVTPVQITHRNSRS